MNFKKLFTGFIVSCLSVALPFSAFAQSGTVSADVLNVRSSTSTSSSIVDTVTNGQTLELLNFDGTWYKVQLANGTIGYVSSEYIIPGPVYYGTITASSLMVRAEANAESDILAKLSSGTVIELLSTVGDWYRIRISDTQYGYVSSEYVSTATPPSESNVAAPVQENAAASAVTSDPTYYGYINATTLNIRESTGTATNVIAQAPRGAKLELLAYDGSWYRVKLADGSIGYVSAEYISLTPIEADTKDVIVTANVSNTYTTNTQSSSLLGQQIIESAYKFIGTPYVYASSGPDSFDCSGFTMYVMNLHGIELPHHSASQYNYGAPVEKDSLTAGDLVFFNSNSRSGVAHVGIYISEGKFIHASSGSTRAVTVSSLFDNYYTVHYLGARRVI